MLITDVIAVNKVNGAIEVKQIRQHERGYQVAAVDQYFSPCSIGPVDGAGEIGDMIVAVGKDGNLHGRTGWSCLFGRGGFFL